MNSEKTICKAILVASLMALAPLTSANALPWRPTEALPSVEKSDLLAWWPALQSLVAGVWGDGGCSIELDGGCVQAPEGATPPAPEDLDEGMSIDPNGGR